MLLPPPLLIKTTDSAQGKNVQVKPLSLTFCATLGLSPQQIMLANPSSSAAAAAAAVTQGGGEDYDPFDASGIDLDTDTNVQISSRDRVALMQRLAAQEQSKAQAALGSSSVVELRNMVDPATFVSQQNIT